MPKEWYITSPTQYLSGYENDEFSSNATDVFNEILANSPETYIVKINDVETTVIIHSTEKDDEFRLLSINDSLHLGDIVDYKNRKYLIITLPFNNKMNDRADMKLCNASLPAGIIQEEVKVQVGTYFNGAPKYEVVQPAVYGEFPCIVESKVITSKTQEAINLPEGQLIVTLPFTEKFKLGESVVLYKESYKIIHIDWTNSYQDKGIIKLTVEREVGTSENT
ncbi:hypothetical protein ACU3L3_06825 [Priestia endophytica]